MSESVTPRREWIALAAWTVLGCSAVADIVDGAVRDDWWEFGVALGVALSAQFVLGSGLWLRLWPARRIFGA